MATTQTRRIGSTVEITIPDVPLFTPERAKAALTEQARLFFTLALQELSGFISEEAPVGVSGHLAQSFASDISGSSIDDLTGRLFSDLPYAIVIDQGRTPGARMPPVEALMTWVERVLQVPGDEKEVRQVAFLVARAIGRKGIAARHFVDKGIERATPRLDGIFAAMAAAMSAALVSGGTGGVAPASGGVGI
jgi:hypothetical protein